MRFQELSHKKLFLTGGTGFFGKSILDRLPELMPETELVILARHPARFLTENPAYSRLPQLRFLQGDVRNFTFPQERFDYVLHAATPAVTTLADDEMRSIILEGTEHVLDFARSCGAGKVLFTSSGAVYGTCPLGMEAIPEDAPCHPVTAYGQAKLEAERMCLASGIYTLLPRCFAFVGPHLPLNIHYAIGNFIRDGLNGEEIVIKGDGTPYRSYLYADDLVTWLLTILLRGEHGRPYHVGSPEGLSIAQLAKAVADQFQSRPGIRICEKAKPGTPPVFYVPEVTRATQELGLSVTVSLPEAIRKTIDFHRQ